MKNQVMANAWQICRKYEVIYGKGNVLFSECLKMAWSEYKSDNVAKPALKSNVVKFTYLKKDGTERVAFGTLIESEIPATKGLKKSADSVQVYFDLEKQEYRCYLKQNFIKICEIIR